MKKIAVHVERMFGMLRVYISCLCNVCLLCNGRHFALASTGIDINVNVAHPE